MEILIAIGSINAFFFSLVIFGKRSITKADIFLAMLLVVLGISFGAVYFSYILKLPLLQLFIWNIGLLIAPLIYLYALLLIKGNIALKKIYFLNFIPYIVSWVYLALLFVLYSKDEIRTLFNSSLTDTSVLFVFFTIIETLSIPVYIVLILRLLRNLSSAKPNLHGKGLSLRGFLHFQLSSLKSSGRNDSNLNLMWLRILIIGVLLIWLLINSLYYLTPLSHEISLKYGFGISSIIIFCLGYIIQSKKLFMK